MRITRQSGCKINLLLNILGKRGDGFHELETVMQPVSLFDELSFEVSPQHVTLTCSDPRLPTDARNLVTRAAELFRSTTKIEQGVKIHLEKQIPMEAGLGGGSGNAAATLLALNELFEAPLDTAELHDLAAQLGSDVPFFLYQQPAIATGRGEKVRTLQTFPALRGIHLLLIHPGFGISTAWAYQELIKFPEALNGNPGRAQRLVEALETDAPRFDTSLLYNSLEAPALRKYPLLYLFQRTLRNCGALGTLMSGSGSTTFGLFVDLAATESALEKIHAEFGLQIWTKIVSVDQ